jgi:diguanylate cyclase (GGDEF)-like protein/PAS domain S-box-containing protein
LRRRGAGEKGAEVVPGTRAPGSPGSLEPVATVDSGWTLLDALRGIVEAMPDAVVILDRHRFVRYASSKTAQVLGVDPAGIVGLDVCDALPLGPHRGMLLAHLDRQMEGVEEQYEIRLETHDGTPRWAAVHAVPRPGPTGEVAGVLWTVRDAALGEQPDRGIRELALRDPLTGVPNRTLLIERLQNAAARARRDDEYQFAVLFLDVDHLKDVNDSFGHTAGDALLRTVARRLQNCLRPEDTIARYGGDEFAILLEGIQSISDVTRIAARIQEELTAPLHVEGYDLSTSASIGIAVNSAAEESVEQLLHHADTAMYRAKALGPGRYAVFDRGMHVQALARLQTEVELRIALQRDQFRLLFQPIVRLADGRCEGVEALLRWDHPERGGLAPGEFLPVAEDTRLILPIGEWVLRRACERMREWIDRLGPAAPDWVAINLSGKELLQPEAARHLAEVVASSGLDPRHVRLEVREVSLAYHEQLVCQALEEFRDVGFGLHLDDFGSGHSSLAALQRLSVRALKIDLSLVRGAAAAPGAPGEAETGSALVRMIQGLAGAMGAAVMAKGVETQVELDLLLAAGCQYSQGFLLGHPMQASATEAMLVQGGFRQLTSGEGVDIQEQGDRSFPRSPNRGPRDPGARAAEEGQSMIQGDGMRKRVILLVEDEPEIVAIIGRALGKEDYLILTANSGEEALTRSEEHGGGIDLLITDIVMPGMGGRELAWRLQELHPHMAVILLSGYADITGAMQMFDSERSIFLEKPLDLGVLRETVREVLAQGV